VVVAGGRPSFTAAVGNDVFRRHDEVWWLNCRRCGKPEIRLRAGSPRLQVRTESFPGAAGFREDDGGWLGMGKSWFWV
jgi:hypothetical protein